MKLILESKELMSLFQKNLKWCDSLLFATAWASPVKGLFKKLLKNRKKIELGIVGIHFYQTHPEFIKAFIDDKKVKFIMQTSGTFHPKIYLFKKYDKWRLIVGSANFTNAAFTKNSEICVQMTNDDNDEDGLTSYNISNILLSYKKEAESFDKKKYENYMASWIRQQKRIRKLSSEYGQKKNGLANNASRPTFLCDLPWKDFYSAVLNEDKKEKGRFKNRMNLLKAVKKIFDEKSNGNFRFFSDLALNERKLIAGLDVKVRGNDGKFLEWGLFGSMRGARDFKGYICKEECKECKQISNALECIPREGLVEQKHYDNYVKKITKLYGISLGTASRLLAMKRPDTFVCVDNENSKGLSKFLRIPNIMNTKKENIFDVYWEDVICRIKDFTWWNEEEPTDSKELFVWKNRAAFFDSLFYSK